MYLINYFIYLYNFKVIYDVTGSTTGPTPVGPVVWEPLPFPILFSVWFLKPWVQRLGEAQGRRASHLRYVQGVGVHYSPLL